MITLKAVKALGNEVRDVDAASPRMAPVAQARKRRAADPQVSGSEYGELVSGSASREDVAYVYLQAFEER